MTALIYVAIIAVWAVVLVPAWLRRHDHLDPERTVDRFTRSMKTLGSRPTVMGIPLPEPERHPEADAGAQVVTVPRPRRPLTSSAPTKPAKPAKPAKRSSLEPARRSSKKRRDGGPDGVRGGARSRRPKAVAVRRVILPLIFLSLVAVGALVAVGILLPIAIAVPVSLLVLFLVVTRIQMRSRRRRLARRAAVAAASRLEPQTPVRRAAERPQGGTWEPRSAPLPTYVTAPPAPGFPRVIDRTTPGAWTAAAMLARAQQEKLQAERMAAAKAEAVARARAEQAVTATRSRDEEYLAREAAQRRPQPNSTSVYQLRVVNE